MTKKDENGIIVVKKKLLLILTNGTTPNYMICSFNPSKKQSMQSVEMIIY